MEESLKEASVPQLLHVFDLLGSGFALFRLRQGIRSSLSSEVCALSSPFLLSLKLFFRVLMGIGEAGYYAGMIYYLSFWYKRCVLIHVIP